MRNAAVATHPRGPLLREFVFRGAQAVDDETNVGVGHFGGEWKGEHALGEAFSATKGSVTVREEGALPVDWW
jgi:hypothetical protein